ncbi:MAG: gamma-glutamyltransferase [Pseudomonadota bacterium]
MNAGLATGHPLTTEAGAQALAEGGTAVDAVLCAAFTAMVVEPVLCGLFGGAFLMAAPPDAAPYVFDGFTRTPKHRAKDLWIDRIEADFGTTTQVFHIGPGTIAAPRQMDALACAHARLGRLPWRALFEPAIAASRQGHQVTAYQAQVLRIVTPVMTATDGARALWGFEDSVLDEGATALNPNLADVLEVLSLEGPRFLNEGEPGQALLAMDGHSLSMDDLTRPCDIHPARELARAGHRVWLTPPPALGGAMVARALNALPPNPSPRAVLDQMRALDLDRGTEDLAEGQSLPQARRGTTHISAFDKHGLGAALTLSNGTGCGHVIPGTGVMPNNMLGEEDVTGCGPADWAEDSALASMMCPMSVLADSGTRHMLGSGGSARIRSALTQVALGLIDHDLPLEAAITAPRVHGDRDSAHFEGWLREDARADILRAHPEATEWHTPSMFFGGVHGVSRAPNGQVTAAGDPRRAGDARTL